jgi:hypothetical protein
MDNQSQIIVSNPLATGTARALRIIVKRGLAWVDPVALDYVVGGLQCRRINCEPGGPRGYSVFAENVIFYELGPNGWIIVPAGMVPRIARELRDRGYTVDITDKRQFGNEHSIDSTVFYGANAETADLLRTIDCNLMGQIEVNGGHDVVYRVAQICGLLSSARIIILTARRCDAFYLRRSLEYLMRQPIGSAYANRASSYEARVIVATYRGCAGFGNNHFDVLIFADGREALGKIASEVSAWLLGTRAVRVYAFVRHGEWLGPSEALRLESMAGPIIYPLASEAISVRVVLCRRVPLMHNLAKKGLDRKRHFWRHAGRNQLIARIAAAFVASDLPALRSMGLLSDAADADWLRKIGTSVKVTVLVESVEHARFLQDFLPGWRLSALGPAAEHDQSIDAALPDPAANGSGKIVSLSYAAAHGIDAHVLIRGDGGTTRLDFPGLPTSTGNSVGRQVLLVDLDDYQDERARRDTKQRLTDYVESGWTIPAGNGADASNPPANDAQAPQTSLPARDDDDDPTPAMNRPASTQEAGTADQTRTRVMTPACTSIATQAGDRFPYRTNPSVVEPQRLADISPPVSLADSNLPIHLHPETKGDTLI